MCTSFVSNRKKTIVGWNLDLLDFDWRVEESAAGVWIEVWDKAEGWMPLFGANCRGDFVGMPACWPYDGRSDPREGALNIINLDIDLLLMRKTWQEVREIALHTPICSVPSLTFMGALSDRAGNVLHVVPGQGAQCYTRPRYKVLTNFSPYKMDSERHPWMGWDRYQTVTQLLQQASEDFDVDDAFEVLRAASQTLCPTVVSMVYDAEANVVYWCENRDWQSRRSRRLLAPAD